MGVARVSVNRPTLLKRVPGGDGRTFPKGICARAVTHSPTLSLSPRLCIVSLPLFATVTITKERQTHTNAVGPLKTHKNL